MHIQRILSRASSFKLHIISIIHHTIIYQKHDVQKGERKKKAKSALSARALLLYRSLRLHT